MKIVRMVISVRPSGAKVFIDRSYDESKDDRENCDIVLKQLSESYDKNEKLAVMEIDINQFGTEAQFKNSKPAIVNLNRAESITIENVGVYAANDTPTEPTAEVVND